MAYGGLFLAEQFFATRHATIVIRQLLIGVGGATVVTVIPTNRG